MADRLTIPRPASTPTAGPVAEQAAELVGRFQQVRARTEELAAPLSPEDQTAQSMPDVSPTKWHRAHTTWFFETFLLEPRLPGYRVHHPAYRYLFNSYYEGIGPRHPRPARGVVTRPGAEEVGRYRQAVDGAMAELLGAGPSAETAGLLELGLHHEEQHQELLLMDIKHVLSCNVLDPVYAPAPGGPVASGAVPPLRWRGHPGGLSATGHAGAGFAYDSEAPRHQVWLQPFDLAERPVTCGEWAAFVDDGGYRRSDLWLSDGWARVQTEGWEAPLYWRRDGNGGAGDGWQVFTLHGLRPLAADEPVCHVSYYEADAYARWAGARLPTEHEWEAVSAPAMEPPAPAGSTEDGPLVLHPGPLAAGGAPGSVWEWTSSAYSPYPGFAPAPGAVGEYNGKFMVDQYVLRGGCCITPPGDRRATYRNFFPAPARWPFTGVRLARDAAA